MWCAHINRLDVLFINKVSIKMMMMLMTMILMNTNQRERKRAKDNFLQDTRRRFDVVVIAAFTAVERLQLILFF